MPTCSEMIIAFKIAFKSERVVVGLDGRLCALHIVTLLHPAAVCLVIRFWSAD
jgi:hypothetical protein